MKLKKLFLALTTLGLGVSCLSGCSFLNGGSDGFTVYWMSHNGNNDELLQLDEHVKRGTVVEYRGKTPTRPAYDYHTYTFSHWDPEPGPITKDTTYRAVYDINRITFKITWKNWDDSVIAVDEVPATYMPEYNHPTPTKPITAQYKYTFKGWDKTIVPAIRDMEYKAEFTEELNKYTINFKNYDGEVLQTSEHLYGDMPRYTGATPQRAGEGAFSYYAFTGWSPTIKMITEDTDYFATFKTYEDDASMFTFEENDSEGYTVTGFSDSELFKQLKYFSIPSEYNSKPVNKIGDYAFDVRSGVTTFTQVNIPSSITHIGNGAFRNCSTLTSISIPSSVTYIGAVAFEYCDSLTEFVIPQSVTYIGSSILSGCNKLTSIEVPFIGSTNDDPNNIGWFFGTGTYIYLPSLLTTIKIDEPCKELSSNVFLGKKFDNVYIPRTVTKFSGAVSAKKLYYGGAIRFWPEIEMSVVNDIDSLYTPSGSSYNLQTSVSLTASVNIKQYGFAGIKCLTTVNLGSAHLVIPDHFLDGCTGLTSFTVAVAVTDIGDYAFYGCTALKTVTVNSTKLKTIGDCAFYGCDVLTGFNFPGTVTSIGAYAFYNCKAITNVDIKSGITSIGEKAFGYCYGLTNASIGVGVETLNKTFIHCSSLKTVTASSVTTLVGTFNHCGALETLNLAALQSYDDESFAYCTSLKAINVTDESAFINNEDDGILYSKDKTKIVYFPKGITGDYVMPDTITELGDKAFLDSNLTSITLSQNLTKIGKNAFEGTKFTSIDIPASVETIDNYAFRNSSLLEIFIPSTVNYIGVSAFSGCNNMTSITLPFIGNSRTSGKAFINLFGTVPSSLETVIISDGPDGITSINADAFKATNTVKNIIVPDSVTEIEKGAFAGCKSLASITLPFVGGSDADDNVFGYIFGEEAANKQQTVVPKTLKIVKLSNAATRIPKDAFDYLRYINEVYTGNGVTSIGSNAFQTCYSLTYILLGTNVSSIGTGAFLNCHNLVEVGNLSSLDIESAKGKTSFGYVAYRADYVLNYSSKYQLEKNPDSGVYVLRVMENSKWVSYCISYGGNSSSVTLPSTNYIGSFMMYYHEEVTSVTIPSTITIIYNAAFSYCTSLSTIRYEGTMAKWNAVDKRANWRQNVPAKKVICSDGEVTL